MKTNECFVLEEWDYELCTDKIIKRVQLPPNLYCILTQNVRMSLS
jgi:hypothetical protein